MLAAVDVVKALKQVGINAVHIKMRARGGVETKTPGPGAQAALRALARNGLKIGRIEEPLSSFRKPTLEAFTAAIGRLPIEQLFCFTVVGP